MADVNQLEMIMLSRPRLWKPAELCSELGVRPWELQRLIAKAKRSGVRICQSNSEQVGRSYKFWIMA